jgi:O-antigen/teichoic acid export membrane protein
MINKTAADTTEDLEEALSHDEVQTIKNRSVVGAFSYFARTAFLQAIGLVSAMVLSAFFSPEDFGVYGYVTQIIGLMIFFSDVGLAASLIQKKDHPSKTDYQSAFTVQQLLSWLIVLVSIGLIQTGFIQAKVGSEGKWILLALSLSFPLASLKTIPSIKLQRKLEFSKLVFPQILEQISFHGILIFLAWKGMGAMAYTWAILIRSLIGTTAMLVIQPWQIGLRINKKALKELISFGAKFQLNDFLARVKDQLFYLVLGNFLPLRQFGFIQWAKTWSMYPYNLTVQNVMSITFPTFSRLQKRKDLLAKAINKSVFFISLAIFPILVGMAVFITPLTQVVAQYQKWQPAIPSFIMFTLSIGWSAISTPLVNTLNAIGRINKSLKLMVIWTVLTWALTPLLIWQTGYHGVALASLLISFTSYLAIREVKKVCQVKIWANLKIQLAGSILMVSVGLIGLEQWSQSLIWFGVGAVVCGLTYIGSVLLFGFSKLKSEIISLKS